MRPPLAGTGHGPDHADRRTRTRLRELVPAAPRPDEDYLDRLLDRYLPDVARALGAVRSGA